MSISHIDRLARLRRRGARAIERFVGLGVCDYEPAMTNLPGAELEIVDLAPLVGDDRAVQRLGAEATRRALAEALETATHVHVAAHGAFDLDDPAASQVYLHDGGVSLRELSALRARDLRVVALSTCWSAEAATLPGRERICLPTALLDVGARAVLASLWAVEDQAGRDFMRDVYKRMRKLGAAAALTRAQAERAGTAPLRDWAGYLCYGGD
jgi:CHAT domain-containing protein